jgi:transposase-like protein
MMDERLRFVAAVREGNETIAELCRRFGIARKTGYKLLERYETEGPSSPGRPVPSSAHACQCGTRSDGESYSGETGGSPDVGTD